MKHRMVEAIILGPDGKFLLRAKRSGKWTLFGGRVGEGESPKEALIRNTLEENGILLQDIEPFDRIENEDTERHIFCARMEGELDNRCLKMGENAKLFERDSLRHRELESCAQAVFDRFLKRQ